MLWEFSTGLLRAGRNVGFFVPIEIRVHLIGVHVEDIEFGGFNRCCWRESGFSVGLCVGWRGVEGLTPGCPVDGESTGIGQGGDEAGLGIERVVEFYGDYEEGEELDFRDEGKGLACVWGGEGEGDREEGGDLLGCCVNFD